MDPTDGLLDDLDAQRRFVRDRAPVYAHLLALLPRVLPRERLRKAWEGRTFGAWYERPLLILGALRDDALEEGPTHPLFGVIGGGTSADAEGPAPDPPEESAVTVEALEAALAAHRPMWEKLAHRHLQTNETSRAVAWLWPAHLVATVDPAASLRLVEVGASAGLNLVADALPRIWTRSDGGALTVDPLPEIEERVGYDLRPLDVDQEASARWLRACVWPGQEDRARRLDQAIDAWRSSSPRPKLVQATAGNVPEGLSRPVPPGTRCLVFQTILRDYLPAGERARYEEGMRSWLDSTPGRALWVELEVTEAAREGGPPAAITVHLADGDFRIATCSPHPKELAVDRRAVEALTARLETRDPTDPTRETG